MADQEQEVAGPMLAIMHRTDVRHAVLSTRARGGYVVAANYAQSFAAHPSRESMT